jgi:hypothetical protein
MITATRKPEEVAMSKYLVVAHQTGESQELLHEVLRLGQEGSQAEFTLLVPATSQGLLELAGWEGQPPRMVARKRAQRIRNFLLQAGVNLVATRLGNADPLIAIEDALRYQAFDAVVICTLPRSISHWLRIDLPAQVARRFPEVQVIHVVANSIGVPIALAAGAPPSQPR